MADKKLIIVESPRKAQTIKKFLSKDYEIESCMGHLRDLPESVKDIPEKYKKDKWSRMGVNVEKDFDPIYCVPKSKEKVLSVLKKKSKQSTEIILATDEDREGESISWHLQELLKSSVSKKTSFKRMVFHEITKDAILESLKNFRKIDKNLVYAQEARRILDRLVGYSISPVLWSKVSKGLSAGRVQSVAVRLLSERELQRRSFKSTKYWDISATFKKASSEFKAQLVSYKGKSLASSADFDRVTGQFKKSDKLLLDEKKVKALSQELKKSSFKVSEIKTQSVAKKPSPPFTTSTLQQEGNRRLGLSAKETMSLAQQLYERGFITYMRTDSVFLSKQAIQAARRDIKKNFGEEYVPDSPRLYSTKSKGAQEAHEAIRPAGSAFIHPVKSKLSGHLLKLYQMIWQRTLASQTMDCKQKRVSVKIEAGSKTLFSASGMQIIFDGFYKIYQSDAQDSKENRLPTLKEGEVLKCKNMDTHEHETKPQARYTEASLIQTLEKEGIGRPSTYAPTIAVIQRRGYVFKDKNMLIPTLTGIIVTKFLTEYFPDYVDTQFTSNMEQVLDDIAVGKEDHIEYLNKIYFGKDGLQKQVEKQKKKENGQDTRSIKLDSIDGFTFFAGPWGAYAVTDAKKDPVSVSIPESVYPGDLTKEVIDSLMIQKSKGLDSLGKDPQTKEPIYLLNGKYGLYLQRGSAKDKESKKDLKRVTIPRGLTEDDVDLKMALKLLELPKTLGENPKTGKEIKKNIGRFGPYVVHDGDFRSVRDVQEFLNLDLKAALKIISEPKKGRKKVLKEVGSHPDTGQAIQVLDGKYGPYIQCAKQRISVPKGVKPESLSLKKALDILNSNSKGAPKTKSSAVKKTKKTSVMAMKKKKNSYKSTTV